MGEFTPPSSIASPQQPWQHCRACDVQWRGKPECWMCGGTVERNGYVSGPALVNQTGLVSPITDNEWRRVRQEVLGDCA